MSDALSLPQKRAARLPWTAEEMQRAFDLRAAGLSFSKIGAAIGRSTDAVGNMFDRHSGPVVTVVCKPWTDAERLLAIALRGEGLLTADIGKRLGRSGDAVAMMFVELRKAGVPVPAANKRAAAISVAKVKRIAKAEQPKRKCLRCGDMFPSWGPGNRRCDPCSKSVDATGMSAWL